MTELERVLLALGEAIDFPPEPDLRPRVRGRLQGRRLARPLVLAFAAVVAAVGVAFAVPPARSAILRFFHIGSAAVQRVQQLPPARGRPLAAGVRPPAPPPPAEPRRPGRP